MTVAHADIESALQQARTRLHRAALPVTASASIGVALLLVGVLWGLVPQTWLLGWLAALTGVQAARLAMGWAHGRAAARAAHDGTTLAAGPWLRRHRLSLLVHGLVWTAGMLLLQPMLPAGHHAPPIYALTALAAGALVALSFDLAAALVFVAPLLLALANATVFSGQPDQRALGGTVLALLALTIFSVRRGQRDTHAAVRLQLVDEQRGEETRRLLASADSARQQLADHHQLLTQLLHTTTQGFWFVDTAGITTDLNPAMCSLLGRPRDAVLGQQVRSFFGGAELQTLEQQIAHRRQGRRTVYEMLLQRPDGSHVDCLVHATPLLDGAGALQGSASIWTDITARRRVEDTLRSHALVANSITDLISVVDRNETYLMVNDAWCTATGLARDQVLGRRAQDVLPSGVSVARRSAMRDAFATGERRVARGLGGAPDLAGRLLETTYYPGHAAAADGAGASGGGVQHVAMVTRDITEQQHTLQQMQAHGDALVTARDEAERANRAKSQFLSQMSHELRTPLNAISGFGQLLQSDTRSTLTAHQQSYVREILRGAQHLLELINEVLDLGRIETGKLAISTAVVQLQPLLDECVALMRALSMSHGVQLHDLPTAPDSSTWSALDLLADRRRLKQVLLNLLGNAIKYNRRGGDVRIVCGAEGGRVHIAVHDSGRGLTPEEQSRLFQPFERLGATGSAIQGTGIGLALSRRLVETMGGDIGATSEPGVGSIFWLRLPLAQQQSHDGAEGPAAAVAGAGETAQPPHPAPPAPPTQHTVLYIEDNAVNVVLMQAMLQRLPEVRLLTAELPERGLLLAQRELPALILLDIQLPGMDGFEVLAELQRLPATRHIPVVAVSANALPADISAALAAGFTDYLTKPLQLEHLLSTVRQWLPQQAQVGGGADAATATP